VSRLISDILQAPEPHFSHTIQQWEQLGNRPGHDARLISDISQRRQEALRALQLDEKDTTPKELFYALRHRAGDSNRELERIIGIKPADTPKQSVDKIVKFVEKMDVPRGVWVVRHTVIKDLLKKQPPKKLLKTLGLRSIDSVLKRNSAYELLSMAVCVESPDWREKFRLKLKKLKPSDFRVNEVGIFQLAPTKAEKFRKAGLAVKSSLVNNYETGSVLVIPPRRRFELDTIGMTMALLQSLHDLRTYSAYFRHISLKSDFGNEVYKTLKGGLPGRMRDLSIGWKPLQRHFNQSPENFSQIEQPYLQYDDIVVVAPLDALGAELPDLEFWKDKGFSFLYIDTPVSMHLMDVIVNASHRLPYERSTHDYLRHKLWEELAFRYLESPPIQSKTIQDIV
jgi:hypothetical protein